MATTFWVDGNWAKWKKSISERVREKEQRKQIMRSKIDECNLWRSAAEQNITKESRMIYVCVKFSCTQKSSSFYYCPPLPRGITRNENEIEWKISLWKKMEMKKNRHTHIHIHKHKWNERESETRGLMIICLGFVSYFLFMPLFSSHSCAVLCNAPIHSFRSPIKKKELILLNIIEFRWHLPLCFQCTRQPNMQNRLQHRTNWIGPSNGKANMEHSRTKCA